MLRARARSGNRYHRSLDGDLGGRIPPILAAPAFDGIKVTDPALDSAMDLVGRIESRSADPIFKAAHSLRCPDCLTLPRGAARLLMLAVHRAMREAAYGNPYGNPRFLFPSLFSRPFLHFLHFLHCSYPARPHSDGIIVPEGRGTSWCRRG